MNDDPEFNAASSQLSRAVGPIFATSAGPITEDQRAVLLWVHTGQATVDASGVRHRIGVGEALWVPPGVEHHTRTEKGSVVLPIFPAYPKPRDDLAEVRTITIPTGWENWLVSQFDLNRAHTHGWHSDVRPLFSQGLQDRPGRVGLSARTAIPLPPMPYSPESRNVARTILRSPGSAREVTQLATEQGISARTLQRQFRTETGMVLSEWRTRARITAAADYLADGRTIGWTGRQVGFVTPAGFTRAFRRYAGVAPRDYPPVAPPTLARDTSGDRQDNGAVLAEDTRDSPPIPARQEWGWVGELHVLWWVQHGCIRIEIGGREFTLHRGMVIWLPAGLPASVVDLAQGSVVLPLGNHRGTAHVGADELRVFSFPDDAEAFLLHTVLTEYFLFRTDAEQSRLADEVFREQFLLSRGSTREGLTAAVATIARALARDPADTRSLSQWAGRLRLEPRRLGQEFLEQTGTTFPRWRAQLRMGYARSLLWIGDHPNEVARAMGYPTPARFRAAFSHAHGISPRAYQQRVTSRTLTEERPIRMSSD